jgi:Xaa-Pro aminopeptidase
MKKPVKKIKKLSQREKLSRMRKAIKFTEIGFKAARYYLKSGITERMLAAKIEYAMRTSGATWFAFPSIVCAHNFKNIHATPTNYKIKPTDTVIIDIGASYKGVCADMTRTFCLRPSEKVKTLYNLVKHAHDTSASLMCPRAKARIIDKTARDIITKAKYKIPHGLGHGVGTRVHENPSLKPRSRHILKTGQVVTIEPGVYLPSMGIRIEDMYLITKHGIKKLTKYPRKL